ncbi:hypothetical protein [Clostridium sp. Marseille-Q2269]|uniref:hypothetical protein n=1 Tax=Clostridium sp. Marseille-Q2269 TaxID=2942205 RepID=UPI0020742861|nr:hypothetical protein [Clostridium sp. Marseille-Q2269]
MQKNILDIDISKKALKNLSELLKQNNYSCVRLSYVKSCCAKGRLDIILDDINKNDLTYKYDSLTIVYDMEVLNNVKNVEIIYKNHDFMMKITPLETNSCCKSTSSSSCTNGCCKSTTSSSCTNGCNNKCPYKNNTCSNT